MERQRVLGIGAVCVAHGDAGLPDAAKAFLDQFPVAVMEGLVAADEKGRRRLRVEGRMQLARIVRPKTARALGGDADVAISGGTNRRLVSSNRPSWMRSTQTMNAGPKAARVLRRRADEVGDGEGARLDDAVAHPAHAPGVLDPVLRR